MAPYADAGGSLQCRRTTDAGGAATYEWSFELSARGGGILAENESAFSDMTLAPQLGYTNAMFEVHTPKESNWKPWVLGRRYYFKLLNGHLFGRLELGINCFGTPGKRKAEIHVRAVSNPSGSAILR